MPSQQDISDFFAFGILRGVCKNSPLLSDMGLLETRQVFCKSLKTAKPIDSYSGLAIDRQSADLIYYL